jgi:thiol-disulfide isomerase/thioredoxin
LSAVFYLTERIHLRVLAPAPAWQLTTLDGQVLRSEQFKGKVVVVDFWATWCAPCLYEMPGYIAMQKEYADRGLVIVGVSMDQLKPEIISKFAANRGINYPVALATPEMVAAFGEFEFLPTTFLIDREGRIRHRKSGPMERADYRKLVVSLL